MSSTYGHLHEDIALVVALCETLVPSMNGTSMRRLQFLLDELATDPNGDNLYDNDRAWLTCGLSTAIQRRAWWANQLGRLADTGVTTVTSSNREYPINLSLVHDGPPILFVNGELHEQDRRAVAVVGTRNATPTGIKLAQEISSVLAAENCTVVSGLAKGIDTAAHTATLDAGGRTIAVFGTPIDKVYPTNNQALAQRISRNGACVSQFLPHIPTGPWAFPPRNITTSALSLATVVVEANATSGARLQAEAALRHGKRVFLVDSLVTSERWAQEMASNYLSVSVATNAELIVKELNEELEVEHTAVFA